MRAKLYVFVLYLELHYRAQKLEASAADKVRKLSFSIIESVPTRAEVFYISGEAVVPVANCDVKEYNSNPKEQLPFKEYIKYWKEYIKNGYRSSQGCLYLKDWHLSR